MIFITSDLVRLQQLISYIRLIILCPILIPNKVRPDNVEATSSINLIILSDIFKANDRVTPRNNHLNWAQNYILNVWRRAPISLALICATWMLWLELYTQAWLRRSPGSIHYDRVIGKWPISTIYCLSIANVSLELHLSGRTERSAQREFRIEPTLHVTATHWGCWPQSSDIPTGVWSICVPPNMIY
jgi:hypothetical protein